MATPAKRRRSLQDLVVFYTVQKGPPKSILTKMKKAMQKLGVTVTDKLSPDVTHIVTGFDSAEAMWAAVGGRTDAGPAAAHVVSLAWHAESVRRHRLLPVTTFLLPQTKQGQSVQTKVSLDCLELLEEEANLRGADGTYSRALAFRNCSCVLKALPGHVVSSTEVRGMKGVGKDGHCLKVITEVLSDGFSPEVERIRDSEWFRSMRAFSRVFGVGAATANEWFSRGLRTIEEVLCCREVLSKQNTQLAVGLAYHGDLCVPVTLREATAWRDLINAHAQSLIPGTTVDITGGFRRGKVLGHDVDLLLSHPDPEGVQGLLPRLLRCLQVLGLIVYGRYEPSTFTDHVLRDPTKHAPLRSSLDHFEKWIGVVRMSRRLIEDEATVPSGVELDVKRFIPQSLRGGGAGEPADTLEGKSTVGEVVALREAGGQDWVARRVDLVVCPAGQFFYALVGWTGSKHFNRSARTYASRELNLRLTSHGLWNPGQGRSIPASSEKEVFENLKLEYREPADRNC